MRIVSAIAIVLALGTLAPSAQAQDKTKIADANERGLLLGRHGLSLQWLDFGRTPWGVVEIADRAGTLTVKGRQDGKGQSRGDFVEIDGVILEVGPRRFLFDGVVRTRVSDNAQGRVCDYRGRMEFLRKDERRFWRMQVFQSPCDTVTDYVDIYMR